MFYENEVNRWVFLIKIMQERHNFFSPSKVEAIRQRAEIEAKKNRKRLRKLNVVQIGYPEDFPRSKFW